jgi:hypothetical protein
MIGLLAVLTVVQQTDTMTEKALVRAAIVRTEASAEERAEPVRGAVRIYVDIPSFRRAIGLSDSIPGSWQDLSAAVGTRGMARRKAEVENCPSRAEVRSCSALAPGEILVHALPDTAPSGFLRVKSVVVWGERRGATRTSRVLVYEVTFRKVAQGYVFDSIIRVPV